MTSRRFLFPLIAAGMALGLWWCSFADRRAGDGGIAPRERDVVVSNSSVSAGADAKDVHDPRAAQREANLEDDYPLAAPLNAPGSTVGEDLDVLGQLFDAWRTNFPGQGNPVGDNREITAALMGDNPRQLALVPKQHRALNSEGELCDRWGTPFRFHPLSGEHMEISSAGPDHKFGTADDTVWSPGS